MMTIAVAVLCGFANWIRGGLFGEEIKAALRSVHPLIEDAWRSVGDRLLTTPLVLAGAAWLSGAHPVQAVAAWLLLYAGFVMGWPWIGMGRTTDPETWAMARQTRGRWLAWIVETVSGLADPSWSIRQRWAYDASCLALRGLVITVPAGAMLLDPWFAAAGVLMPLAYEAGQHMPGRWRGTGAGEFIFGAVLGAALST